MRINEAKLDFDVRTLYLRFDDESDVQAAYDRIRQEPKMSAAFGPERYKPEDFDFILHVLVLYGHKITAIKMRRMISGEYLLDAKEYVDKLDTKNF